MVWTTEGLTGKIPMSVVTPGINKKTTTRKPIHQFSELFDVKEKTTVLRLGFSKTKRKATRKGIYLWYTIQKRTWYIKINACLKQTMHDWILQHTHIVESPIANDCVKVSVDGKTENKLSLSYYCRCL